MSDLRSYARALRLEHQRAKGPAATKAILQKFGVTPGMTAADDATLNKVIGALSEGLPAESVTRAKQRANGADVADYDEDDDGESNVAISQRSPKTFAEIDTAEVYRKWNSAGNRSRANG